MAAGGKQTDLVTVHLKTDNGVIKTMMNHELAAIVLDPNGDPNTKKLIRDAVIKEMSGGIEQKDCNDNSLKEPPITADEPSCSRPTTLQGSTRRDSNASIQPGLPQIHIWREEEEKLLLELRLGEENSFNSSKSHGTLWNKITQIMNDHKISVTKAQIINKWKTLKKKYKEVVDQNDKSGNSKTTWKYYETFNDAYGNKAGTHAAVTYDSEKQEIKINDCNIPKAGPSKNNEKHCSSPKAGPSKRKSEIETMSDRVETQNDKLLSVLKRQHNQKMRKTGFYKYLKRVLKGQINHMLMENKKYNVTNSGSIITFNKLLSKI